MGGYDGYYDDDDDEDGWSDILVGAGAAALIGVLQTGFYCCWLISGHFQKCVVYGMHCNVH